MTSSNKVKERDHLLHCYANARILSIYIKNFSRELTRASCSWCVIFCQFFSAYLHHIPEITPLRSAIRDSIVVSISACHADDPGSIPGRGGLLLLFVLCASGS